MRSMQDMKKITNPHNARESWLRAVLDGFLRPHFKECGYTIPKNVLVTVGWPPNRRIARNGRSRIAGVCCPTQWNDGKAFIIYLTPQEADADEYLSTLVHELVHATVGLKAKHGADFKECGEAVGLEGKPTQMHAQADGDLAVAMRKWVKRTKLGKFPHHRELYKAPRQTTRMLKCGCKNRECETYGLTQAGVGYTVRSSYVWLRNYGAPDCPACTTPMNVLD